MAEQGGCRRTKRRERGVGASEEEKMKEKGRAGFKTLMVTKATEMLRTESHTPTERGEKKITHSHHMYEKVHSRRQD